MASLRSNMHATPVNTRRALPWAGVVVSLEADLLHPIKCRRSSCPTRSGSAALGLDTFLHSHALVAAGTPPDIHRLTTSWTEQ